MELKGSKRKESILATANQIICELGLQGLTMREIGRRQDISEPAVYRHYVNKEEILMAVLKRCAAFETQLKQSLLDTKTGPKDRIRLWAGSYINFYLNTAPLPELILQDRGIASDSDLYQLSVSLVNERYQLIEALLEKALINNNHLANSFSSEYLSNTIMGLIQFSILRWRANGKSFDLQDYVNKSLEQLFDLLADNFTEKY